MKVILSEPEITDFVETTAGKAAREHKGDLVEIGVGNGHTTQKLVRVAESFKRKVIAIDPFEKGWNGVKDTSYTHPYPRKKFEVESDCLILHTERSDHPSSKEILKRQISFAYIDGLQDFDSVMNDLLISARASVIVVDDYDRKGVKSAVDGFIKMTNRQLILYIKSKTTLWALIR